ncbi:uncharacterized protein BO96DRAFT_431981 [Aspergillus niger CBS 101883]|uniref:Uncharacterized protein n=2 Tax=Aspergillus niger TaxID=5061 RepID=A2QR93_ASPNC|nr:uncharacterized protein BO96DRAFT_431981 [Aspergillus niger CBS 101883]XP_059604030.1 hypothetical protein An08g05220 [Aspergillus niger]PYH58886.1 hypothetical protein BO96DRAFT_431981 [Aspergillus niger CBS 101883]CAK45494.1 hypothetical protein An08g05220 [Aspergillus niger]
MVAVLSSLRPELRPNGSHRIQGRLRRGIDWDRVVAGGESGIDEKQALDHRPQTRRAEEWTESRRPSGRPAAVCDMASFNLELFWLQLRPAKKCHCCKSAGSGLFRLCQSLKIEESVQFGLNEEKAFKAGVKNCHPTIVTEAALDLVLAKTLRSRVKLPMIDSFTFSALINSTPLKEANKQQPCIDWMQPASADPKGPRATCRDRYCLLKRPTCPVGPLSKLHRWGLQSETHPLAEFAIHMYQRPTKLFSTTAIDDINGRLVLAANLLGTVAIRLSILEY